MSELGVGSTYHHVDFGRAEFNDRCVHALRCARQIGDGDDRPRRRPLQVPISAASRLR